MSSRGSFLLLVVAGLCWGTGGVTGRALTQVAHLSAPAVAAYRLLLGGGLLIAVLAVTGHIPRGSASWARIGAVAGLSAVFQAAYFSAVAVSSVAIATLLTIGSAPILVVGIDAISTRRPPGWAAARPVLVGLVGLGLLVGSPTGQPVRTALAGAGLSMLSGAGFALLTLLGRRPVPGLNDAVSTGYGFGLGGLLLSAVTVAATGTVATLRIPGSVTVLALLLLLATVPTAVAYTLYFRGLHGSTATTGTVVALLEPLTGTLLALALFGEHVSIVEAVGATLLLTSVLDSGRAQTRRPHFADAS